MATSDSAFLWETEALRSSRPTTAGTSEHRDWITLREAHEQTGISVPTLRRWARKDLIPSYLEPYRDGQLRMVSKSAVVQRAADLGRTDEPASRPAAEPTPEPEPGPGPTSPPSPPVPHRDEPEAPSGTMLVPIDAWDKMLMQLGNLHQAGQELAEARERAAKAETEVKFLKERLAERRAVADSAPPAGPESPGPARDHAPQSAALEKPATGGNAKSPGLTRLMWRAWRTRLKD